jgi:transposase-like protein
MRKRRVFTPEFRAEAVPFALEGERPSSESARELGIRPDQLRHCPPAAARPPGASGRSAPTRVHTSPPAPGARSPSGASPGAAGPARDPGR